MDRLRNKFEEMNYGVDSVIEILQAEIISCDAERHVCFERAKEKETT